MLGLKKVDYLTLIMFAMIILCDIINVFPIAYAHIVFMIWLFLMAFHNKKAIKSFFLGRSCRPIWGYCTILILTSIIGSSFIWGAKISLSFIMGMSPAIAYNYYRSSNQNIKPLTIVLLLILFIMAIYASYIGSKYEDLGRSITAGVYDGDMMAFGGVALASGAAVFAVYLVGKLHSLSLKWKIILLPLILVMISMVITSGSTISSVCLLIFLCLAIINVKYRILLWFVMISITILFFAFYQEIGLAIIQFSYSVDDAVSSMRLRSLGSAIIYGSSGGDGDYFFGRIDRPLLSLQTFLNNPFFGVAYKYGNDWNRALSYGVGCHGEWADALARFGILGLVYFKIFANFLQEPLRNQKNKMWFWIWIVMGLFNPAVSFFSNLILFFIIPATSTSFFNNENK